MARNRSQFASLHNYVKIEVKLGDDKIVSDVGKGMVSFFY